MTPCSLAAVLLIAQASPQGAPPTRPHAADPQPAPASATHAAAADHGAPPAAAGHAADAHAAAGDHGGHGNAAACAKATPLEQCKNPSLCATHDTSVAGAIFHHVTDEPYFPICLDRGEGKVIDLTISKHVVWMWIAAGLLVLAFVYGTARRSLVPKGFYSLLESFVVFIRDEIAVKNIGEHDAHRYVGYLCTAFFFILFMNLIGLVPYGATATGNLSVTVVLALCTFALTQVAGMRAQGVVGYWLHLVPSGVPKWLFPIMVPVEILGLLTKPFALTVRLFANMVAGHIIIMFLLALTVLLSAYVAPVSVAFALGIFLLELFVALVQAYIFTMLSALFIGMAAHAH
jgi:F-type H+-transporting ATPase subunit a